VSRILSRCTAAALTASAIASAVAAAGCAGGRSGATPNTTPPVTLAPITQRVVRADGSTINVNAAPVNAGITTRVAAPLDSAWTALKAAYRELGIPVTTLMEPSHLVENDSYAARRHIGKVPMAKILDCGSSQGMPNAESFEILMSISSYLVKNPAGGLDLVTRIEASGTSPYFSGSARVNCPTLGELEREIAEMVSRKSGR